MSRNINYCLSLFSNNIAFVRFNHPCKNTCQISNAQHLHYFPTSYNPFQSTAIMNQFKAKGKLNVCPLFHDYIIAISQKKICRKNNHFLNAWKHLDTK